MTARPVACAFGIALFSVLVAQHEPAALGAGDGPDRIASLELRIEKLEEANRTRVKSTELNSLRLKVTELERMVREVRPTGSSQALGSQRSESMQRQATDSLKRSVSTLQARLTTEAQNVTQVRRELDRLRLQLSTLQNKVDRLGR